MTYSVIDVAKYIINKSIEDGNPVSNLKLQKLLYYVQAASLVRFGSPIFKEDLVAWKYGPVSREIYNMYSSYSYKNIEDEQEGRYIEEEHQKLINEVIEAKNNHTAFDLVYDTHQEEPWKNTPHYGNITTESMRDFFNRAGGHDRIWLRKKE